MRRVDSLEKTDAWRDWGQEKRMTEDEMAGWHHRLNRCKFEWSPGVGGGQVCCNSWGPESEMTERLNWTEGSLGYFWELTNFIGWVYLDMLTWKYQKVFISIELFPSSILSHFSHILLFATLWTLAHQAPLSMGFSRQEYWSELPLPPQGDLLDPGTEPASCVSCIGR